MAKTVKEPEVIEPTPVGSTGKIRFINISQIPIDIMLTNGDELRLEIPRKGSSNHISKPISKGVIPPGVIAMGYGNKPYIRIEEVLA